MNTIKERVNIYGKLPVGIKNPIIERHTLVSIAFVRAIIDCALKISQKPFHIFSAIIRYSL